MRGLVLLLLSLPAAAYGAHDSLVAVSRSGLIEFNDPVTLKTLNTIQVNLPKNTTGLNGVFADPDGRTLYLEGPAGGDAAGCCWLYSINLETLESKVVADVWGTRSRRAYVDIGPGLLKPVSAPVASATEKPEEDRWSVSPDGHWWFGLRSGPSLDLFDSAEGIITRSFSSAHSAENSAPSGVWLSSKFYVYANGSRRIWPLSPKDTQLGEGDALPNPGSVRGCRDDLFRLLTGRGDLLFLFEVFGGTTDRRQPGCEHVPGGYWVMQPSNLPAATRVASKLHFWVLLPNADGSNLYGVTAESRWPPRPAKLVRMDAKIGAVLKHRTLDAQYWFLTIASQRLQKNSTIQLSSAQ